MSYLCDIYENIRVLFFCLLCVSVFFAFIWLLRFPFIGNRSCVFTVKRICLWSVKNDRKKTT